MRARLIGNLVIIGRPEFEELLRDADHQGCMLVAGLKENDLTISDINMDTYNRFVKPWRDFIERLRAELGEKKFKRLLDGNGLNWFALDDPSFGSEDTNT